MAKRRTKNRTHAKASPEDLKKIPKSMVIRVGQVSLGSHSLNQLVKDFRTVMQPHTAIKLRERKSNKLKDFVVMCGPLGVSHLFIFTQSEKTGNVSLKISRTPQGPTITFQVQDYSLGKDIKKFLKRPKSLSKEDILNPPLLVLNGFHIKGNEDEDKANVEKVIVSMFQNVFPPLNPAKIQLNTIKRVFMINKDSATGEISLRHYSIDVREVDLSKNLKKLYKSKQKLNKAVPNLHRKDDIASLILDHDIAAYTSESEIEEDAIVKVMDKQDKHIKHIPRHSANKNGSEKSVKSKAEGSTVDGEEDVNMDDEDAELEQDPEQEEEEGNNQAQQPKKKAIKLTEIGPRLTLKLVKIEEGICAGKVLHHEYVKKSDSEIKVLEKRHAQKMKLKEQRKKEQEENIARKKAVKEAKKQRKLERRKAREEAAANGEAGEEVGSADGASDSSDSSDSDSEDNYSDVPEDLDSDLYSDVDEGN